MAKKLYVGGLSYDTVTETLTQLFASAGKVESVNIIMDKATGRSKGFSFIEMSTEEEAKKAIEMFNGREVDGRKIKVNEAQPQGSGPRRNGGGGRGFGGPRY